MKANEAKQMTEANQNYYERAAYAAIKSQAQRGYYQCQVCIYEETAEKLKQDGYQVSKTGAFAGGGLYYYNIYWK